jgi:uncharacterized protein (TIGR02145 family)
MLKNILSIGSAFFTLALSYAQQETGTFIDERDGQVYKWVTIDNETWMAQNLNIESVTIKFSDGTFEESFIRRCYKNVPDNCREYGGLYTEEVINFYAKAQGRRNICPKGWHLPSENEWFTLINYLGGQKVAGNAMKEPGPTHWKGRTKGVTNSSGFSALPGGVCFYDEKSYNYIFMGGTASFWSSTRIYSILLGADGFSTFRLYKNTSKVHKDNSLGVSAQSVRCIRDW